MAILEVHRTAITLAAATPLVIDAQASPVTGKGVGVTGVDTLTILITNTGETNAITAGAVCRSLDPLGARFGAPAGSVVIPGGSIAPGATWEIAWAADWPPSYWCQLTLTSELGTTVDVDFLGRTLGLVV